MDTIYRISWAVVEKANYNAWRQGTTKTKVLGAYLVRIHTRHFGTQYCDKNIFLVMDIND